MILTAPDETDGLQPLNPVMRQFALPVHLPLGHNPSGQPEVLRPAVRHVAVAVFLFELDEFTIPALPTIIVPVKLEPQILEPLDPLLAQQTLPVPFPLVADPFAKFRVPRAGRGNIAVAVIGPELGQLVELVCPASGM